MKVYQIWVNNRPYMGEDPEKTYSSGEAWSGNSFHTRKLEMNILIFENMGVEPKLIVGDRSLKSEIDRIMRRSQDGLLDIFEIRITGRTAI